MRIAELTREREEAARLAAEQQALKDELAARTKQVHFRSGSSPSTLTIGVITDTRLKSKRCPFIELALFFPQSGTL